MKKKILISWLLILNTLIFSQNLKNKQNENYVSLYRNAVFYFEHNDYGKALTFAEDAITYKKAKSDYEIKVLNNSLSAKSVKNAGDSIVNILKVLERRDEKESIGIITNYLKIKGESFFENSIGKMLEFIHRNSEYPEAQFLIGQIYKLEGEYNIAETYYSMALNNKEVLDIPDFKYEILYSLSEISLLEKNYDKYETRLLNVLVDDKFVSDENLKRAMLNTIANSSVERFFTLYRASDFISIKAYNNLTEYYYEKGFLDKALYYCTLSVITSFTKINEVMLSRNSEYEYSNLVSFFDEVNANSDIVKWGTDNDVWKSFNMLAKISKESGYLNFSQTLLRILVKHSPQEYWQKESVLQLENF